METEAKRSSNSCIRLIRYADAVIEKGLHLRMRKVLRVKVRRLFRGWSILGLVYLLRKVGRNEPARNEILVQGVIEHVPVIPEEFFRSGKYVAKRCGGRVEINDQSTVGGYPTEGTMCPGHSCLGSEKCATLPSVGDCFGRAWLKNLKENCGWVCENPQNASLVKDDLINRRKMYANKRRKPIEFQAGDKVMLKVSPWKGVVRFGKKGKLRPRFVGPFSIVERIGEKCLAETDVVVPLDDIQVDEQLTYIEEPVAILDFKVKKLRNKDIRLVRVQWKFHKGQESTWEVEADVRSQYPHLEDQYWYAIGEEEEGLEVLQKSFPLKLWNLNEMLINDQNILFDNGGGSDRRWSGVVQIDGGFRSKVVRSGSDRWWSVVVQIGDGSKRRWLVVVQIGSGRQWFRTTVVGGREWSVVVGGGSDRQCRRWFRTAVVSVGRWWFRMAMVQNGGGRSVIGGG
ncbi:hypothetical protein L6452_14196 [Arctium lappa]|uniref:Uncharacterized protein n=1 Tax=Arctium lappa TaxID=4217 RepID=A0ACB9CKL9_ARCLA|nr:hypothetical protein L6452_14196 [Arctium lappa]